VHREDDDGVEARLWAYCKCGRQADDILKSACRMDGVVSIDRPSISFVSRVDNRSAFYW
jgi:hypothetical protein